MSTIHYGSNSQAECGASDGLVSLKAAEVTCRTCRGWLPIVAPELQAPVYPTAIHSEQMTDIYGVAIDVHPVRTFRDGRQMGAGYDLGEPSNWFVFDRDNEATKWHKHCGPYSSFEQAKDWINGIRETRAVRRAVATLVAAIQRGRGPS